MKSKHIAIIDGTDIWLDHSSVHPRIWWVSNMRIDCDGSGGNPDNDPDFQPHTTLKHKDGTDLNAYKERFIVVNKSVIASVPEIVMGCEAKVTYLDTGANCDAVVGDLGPSSKIGEASCATASALGINPNPNHGGEDDKRMVLYECWPGQAAIVDGVQYPLQPS